MGKICEWITLNFYKDLSLSVFISHSRVFVICGPVDSSSASFKRLLFLNLKDFFVNLPHTPKTLSTAPFPA